MQAFVYCRVSSEEQATDNHYSLENQEQKARDYAKSKGWRIAEVRKDVVSGKDANREGYKDLISSIKTGKIDCVLVYRLDRLSRNIRDIYDFLDLIKKHDIGFVSLNEGFDTTTAMGRAMLFMAAVFAQLTREMIAENVKDGLMRRAQAGLYNGTKNGPFGYKYSAGVQTLVPIPEEAEVVRLIYSLFAERRWGVHKIVGYLNEEYIGTRNNCQWAKSRVHNILRNPVYIGKVNWHGEFFEGKHEPILSDELYNAAQEVAASRTKLPSRSHQTEHLLSGLAECGICGRRLTAHYGPKKKKDDSRYIFYSHRTDRRRDECKAFHKSADKLERVVFAEIRKQAESDLLSGPAREELEKQIVSKAEPLRQRRQTILAELVEMKDKFNSWAERLDRGHIDEEQFRQQNSKLLERKQALQTELTETETELAGCENAEVSLEAAREALSQFPKVWEHLETEERRDLLRTLTEKLEVYRDKVVLKLLFLPAVEIQM